jgi:hypothetical protein
MTLIILPYFFFGLWATGGSVAAFAFLGYDLANLTYLLPLFLIGCFCMMQALRYGERSQN